MPTGTWRSLQLEHPKSVTPLERVQYARDSFPYPIWLKKDVSFFLLKCPQVGGTIYIEYIPNGTFTERYTIQVVGTV